MLRPRLLESCPGFEIGSVEAERFPPAHISAFLDVNYIFDSSRDLLQLSSCHRLLRISDINVRLLRHLHLWEVPLLLFYTQLLYLCKNRPYLSKFPLCSSIITVVWFSWNINSNTRTQFHVIMWFSRFGNTVNSDISKLSICGLIYSIKIYFLYLS